MAEIPSTCQSKAIKLAELTLLMEILRQQARCRKTVQHLSRSSIIVVYITEARSIRNSKMTTIRSSSKETKQQMRYSSIPGILRRETLFRCSLQSTTRKMRSYLRTSRSSQGTGPSSRTTIKVQAGSQTKALRSSAI